MKKLRKINNNFIFFFILLLCLEFNKCLICDSHCTSNDGITCSSSSSSSYCNNCKPKYGSEGVCYSCTGTYVYYTIDSSGNCLINQCIGDKIIGRSNECTSIVTPGNYYKLGDVYYSTNPHSLNSLISCNSNNICKCSQYYYTQKINGKLVYNCKSESVLLSEGYKFYNYKTGEFFKTQCPEGYKIMKQTTSSSKIRCSDTCLIEEYYQRIKDSATNLYKEYTDTDIHETNLMTKAMTWYGIEMDTMMDKSISNVADLFIKGTNMGIIEGKRLLNNKTMDKKVHKICKEYVKMQEAYLEKLKEYF